MLDSQLFINAIKQLNEDRDIPVETMIEALEEAFVNTYHKEFDPEAELRVETDVTKGMVKLFHIKRVVETVEDSLTEISLVEAQKDNPTLAIGDAYETEVEFNKDFSSLAALQVKQIIRQKIREKEKELVLTRYSDKIGDMIEGNVEKIKEHFYIIAFDRTFGFLNKNQTPRDIVLGTGDKVRAVIEKIDPNSKGVPIILSMNSVEFVKRILEEEIPEIAQGTIIIDKIARYGGVRTKMIVKSATQGLDAVGTIVGPGGERIQRIIKKVGREFIDVIPEIEGLDKQIARAFVPAKPIYVRIDGERATVVVKEEDFSPAIGRGGSNAKVVSRLLGIEIDVIKEAEATFDIPTGFTYTENRKSVRQTDIDASEYMINEDEMVQDDIFEEGLIVQEEDNNFGFEDIADIPEVDNFEGFAVEPDEDDPFQDQEVNDSVEDDQFQDQEDNGLDAAREDLSDAEDFDKYYE